MRMNATNKKIGEILQQRDDYKVGAVFSNRGDEYLSVQFQLPDGTVNHPIIIHAVDLEDGPALRICDLRAAKFHDANCARRFCEEANAALFAGCFIVAKENPQVVTYLSHHLLPTLCPHPTVLNRAVDRALHALEFCRDIAATIERAQSRERGWTSTGSDPALN